MRWPRRRAAWQPVRLRGRTDLLRNYSVVFLFYVGPCCWHLFNCVLAGDSFPAPPRQVFILPLEKPGRDPENCGPKSPMSKARGGCNLPPPAGHVEPILNGRQDARKRPRVTETHLQELLAFAAAARVAGDFLQLASRDVHGSFDASPLPPSIATLEQAGVNTYVCRYLRD